MTFVKKFLRFIIPFPFVYFAIGLVLTYWSAPERKVIENFDYSSLKESTQDFSLGEERWVTTRDGSKLFTRTYNANSDTTLLLLHGSGSESRYLSKVASYLSGNNTMRVITPDLRGHGRNEDNKGDIGYLGQLDHDVEDLIQHIRKEYGDTKIVLGGHSSGGGMALRYAGNKNVVQPDALLLYAPYLGHDAPTVKPASGDWVSVSIKRWIGLTMINNLGISAFNDLPVLVFNRPESWDDELQVDSYSYRMAVNFAPNAYKKDIANIRVPTLVMVGENDESFYPEQFAPLFESSEIDINVHVIPNANHMGIVDTTGANQRLIKWFNALSTSQLSMVAHSQQ